MPIRRQHVRVAPPRLDLTHVVHTLHPGDVACADQGERLETLLGSCVAVVLTDPRRTIGVMCHIVHQGAPTGATKRTSAYAEVAFEAMFAMLLARGIIPALCEAYVYGGGNMFPDLVKSWHVGDTNARWALDTLIDLGIPVLFHDVGGNTYRRLSWTVGTAVPQVIAIEI